MVTGLQVKPPPDQGPPDEALSADNQGTDSGEKEEKKHSGARQDPYLLGRNVTGSRAGSPAAEALSPQPGGKGVGRPAPGAMRSVGICLLGSAIPFHWALWTGLPLCSEGTSPKEERPRFPGASRPSSPPRVVPNHSHSHRTPARALAGCSPPPMLSPPEGG